MKTRWVCGLALRSSDFPVGTPLNHFFAWNESAPRRDRRYIIACDVYSLITGLGGDDAAHKAAVAHLSASPIIAARRGRHLLLQEDALSPDLTIGKFTMSLPLSSRRRSGPTEAMGTGLRRYDKQAIVEWNSKKFAPPSRGVGQTREAPIAAAQQIVESLTTSIGSTDIDRHAALFAGFELLANEIDLDRLARRRPKLVPFRRHGLPRRVLVLRLSALGDFVQGLGPAAAIRRHHRGDHITLLTTSAFGEFAERLGLFDGVMIDRRPGPFDIGGWIELRRRLRQGRFDRVYDLQTSQRSGVYARLLRLGPRPEWSGVAAGCSHPHANLDRDRQHTIDKQAEQLLMAGIYPTPLPALPPLCREPPTHEPIYLAVHTSPDRRRARTTRRSDIRPPRRGGSRRYHCRL